jgi:hypothetical protein
MIRVRFTLDDPDGALAAFGAGALLRVERAASEDGSYAELTTIAVVSGTLTYEYDDDAGDESSWYRWRLSDAANTKQGGYAAAFRGETFTDDSAPDAYATLADFAQTFGQDVLADADDRTLARYRSVLTRAASQINAKLKRDFFRHPAPSGTEVRYFDGTGRRTLCVHAGFYTTDDMLVEVSLDGGQTFTELASTDWYPEPLDPQPGFPWFHIAMATYGAYPRLPVGRRLVRVTAAYGWSAPLPDVVEANVARARQLAASDPTLSGIVGPEELGRLVASNRMPDAMYQLLRDYSPLELGTNCAM